LLDKVQLFVFMRLANTTIITAQNTVIPGGKFLQTTAEPFWSVGCGGCLQQGTMSHCKFERKLLHPYCFSIKAFFPGTSAMAPPCEQLCLLLYASASACYKCVITLLHQQKLKQSMLHLLMWPIQRVIGRSTIICPTCRPSSRFLGFSAQEAMQAWYGQGQVLPTG